jgi:hypothetical protein
VHHQGADNTTQYPIKITYFDGLGRALEVKMQTQYEAIQGIDKANAAATIRQAQQFELTKQAHNLNADRVNTKEDNNTIFLNLVSSLINFSCFSLVSPRPKKFPISFASLFCIVSTIVFLLLVLPLLYFVTPQWRI